MDDPYNLKKDRNPIDLVEFKKTTGTFETDLGTHLQWNLKGIALGITIAEGAANGMENAPFTYKAIKWKIPNILGGKYNIYEFTFLRGVSSGEVRTIGRGPGEDLAGPGMMLAGLFLTVTPNQVENHLNNAPIEERLYELGVDMMGFGISELVGDVVQIGGMEGLSPWVSVPAGVFVDMSTGALWDSLWYGRAR